VIDQDDLQAFAAMFPAAKAEGFVDPNRLKKRAKAEKRSQMSDRQISRGGRIRTEQMNFRCTPAHKALTARLADALGISQADVVERAVQELARAIGVNLDA
jgi:hypothetical protein